MFRQPRCALQIISCASRSLPLDCRQQMFLSSVEKQFVYSSNARTKMVPFKSIPVEDLGHSILLLRENSSQSSPTDKMRRGIIFAKVMSLGSSAIGAMLMPVFVSNFMGTAAASSGSLAFLVISNTFLGLLTLTPFLLHFLAKRHVANLYYNKMTEVFTSVHFGFFMQKRALRFKSSDVVDVDEALRRGDVKFPLATCIVRSHPLLLLLDKDCYSDEIAYNRLVRNLQKPCADMS